MNKLKKMWAKVKSWTLWSNLLQCLIAFDQLLYCTIATILSVFNHKISAYADMTLSAQFYRLSERGCKYGKILMYITDFIFIVLTFRKVKKHCYKAYQSELSNSHLPNDLK